MIRTRAHVLLLAGMLLLVAWTAWGEEPAGVESAGEAIESIEPIPPAPPPPPNPERLREMVGLLRVARLTQALRLQEDEAARLAVRLRELSEARQELERVHMELLPRIEVALRDLDRGREKSGERLGDLLKELRAREASRRAEVEKLDQRVQDLLTVEQQARMLLFEQNFEREVREMIRLAREMERPRLNSGRPPRPGVEAPRFHEPPPPPPGSRPPAP